MEFCGIYARKVSRKDIREMGLKIAHIILPQHPHGTNELIYIYLSVIQETEMCIQLTSTNKGLYLNAH